MISSQKDNGTLAIMAVFVLVAIVLNIQTLSQPGLPVHGDLTFPSLLDNYASNYRYLFSDSGSISNLESIDRAAVLLPLSALASITGLGIDFVYRALYLGIPFISMLSMLSLLRFAFRSIEPSLLRPVALIPPCILYALSPWVLEQMQAYLFWLAYALTPLMIVLAFRFFENLDLRSAACLALVLTAIASTPQYLVFSCVAVAAIGLAQIADKRRRGKLNSAEAIRTVTATASFVVMFAALNFYWLYPSGVVLVSGRSISPGFQADPGMTQLFSTNSSALNILRGHDQWITWYQADSRLAFTFNRFWIVNSLVVPIVAFSALVGQETRRCRLVQVIALLGLAYGALAMGTSTPVYDWLVFDLPIVSDFAWVLRVPGKLSYLLWVFYALMLGVVIAKILNSSLRRLLKVPIITAILISIAASVAPKSLIYFLDYYAPVKAPTSYEHLNDYLATNSDGMGRVLFIAPYDFAFGENSLQFETSYTWNPDRLAAASPAISASAPSISYYHLTYRDWQFALYPMIYPRLPLDLGKEVLAEAGVQYIAYHNDIVGAEDRGERDLVRLRRSDLELVATFGQIRVFRNPYYEGVIRAEMAHGDIQSWEVEKINPAEYRIQLAEADAASGIIMGQPFDPMWVGKVGNETISPEPFGQIGMRFEIPEGASEMTIEYFPQPFYEFGLLVSGAATLIVFLMLIVIRKYRSREPWTYGPRLR